MVHYKSDDGVHDAPVDKIWKLIEAHSDENVSKIHPGFKKSVTVEKKPTHVVREYTMAGPGGKTHTERIKTTLNPPKSMTMEWLTGPWAGSRCTNTYLAEGKKTRIVSEGDFRVEGMDDKSALKIVAGAFDSAFTEDGKFLKTLK